MASILEVSGGDKASRGVRKLTWFQARCWAAFRAYCQAAITRGALRVVLPTTGHEFVCGEVTSRDPWQAEIHIHDPYAIVRIVKDTDIGLGEAYVGTRFTYSYPAGPRLLPLATHARLADNVQRVPNG